MKLRRFARGVAGRTEQPQASGPGRRQGGTTGKMRRAKPPNVIGRGPLLAERGFGVVIVCIVKDEADYLEEWLAYHFALGVDHVLLYDNGSTDGSATLLKTYQNHGLVTVIDWPLGGAQLAAYNHALRFLGAPPIGWPSTTWTSSWSRSSMTTSPRSWLVSLVRPMCACRARSSGSPATARGPKASPSTPTPSLPTCWRWNPTCRRE